MDDLLKKVQSLHLVEWFVGVLCFLIGLLFVLGDALADGNIFDAAGIILGVVLIVLGSGIIIFNAMNKKLLSSSALIAAVILALGIASVVENFGVSVIALVITFCPYLLITLGALFFVSIIVDLACKKSLTKSRIIILCTGVVILIVGILILAINALNAHRILIGGIILMLIGCAVVLNIFFNFAKNISSGTQKIKRTIDDTQK